MNHLQTLLHDSLKATGHVEDYAILRRRDFSLRAGSVAFSITPAKIEEITEAFKNPTQTRDGGISLENIHYKCVRADKFSIYGKKDDCGLVLVKTASLVLLGTYNSEMYPSICVEAVEKLADYFREKGK